jgi:hypothetical protein
VAGRGHPGAVELDEPAAISLTAFFARPLRLAQSLPPSLSSDGASPPT